MLLPDDSSIEIIANVRIPMRDGAHLAGNLYRTAGAGREPCVVNYMPYHKDGRGGRGSAEAVHRHFARRGYAVLVIDLRGTGCSEGINNVPFDAQEGRDGHDAVEWAARQPWCDGNVGMWGISYGGITALKTAAEQPPHLKAIVPVHATADLVADFLTFGGCAGGFWTNGDWGPRMVGYNLTPPLCADPDGTLARLWLERLQHFEPWPLEWYRHPTDGPRWAERATAVERITAATLAVCGWRDFYVDGTLAYFNRLQAPKKLLMGPWKHVFPNASPVEPVNVLELMVQWWDRWLRGRDNGAEAGPPVTIYVQGKGKWHHQGAWQSQEAWPPAGSDTRGLHLLPMGQLDFLGEDVRTSVTWNYRSDPTVGLDSIGHDPWTTAVLKPGLHNGDDSRSAVFTSRPLGEDWEVTGQARLLLSATMSAPGQTVVAKLCDVDASGRSRLVTMGWCKDTAAEFDPAHTIVVPLRATAYVFGWGHQIRLSLALADFPRLWPAPGIADLCWHQQAATPSVLLLPHTPPRPGPLPPPEFPPLGESVKSAAELESTQHWGVSRELVQPQAALGNRTRSVFQLLDGGTVTYEHEYSASVSEQSGSAAAIRSASLIQVAQPGGSTRVRTENHFTATSVRISAEIEQNGAVIFRKQWEHRG
jgi:uncharacterized protein